MINQAILSTLNYKVAFAVVHSAQQRTAANATKKRVMPNQVRHLGIGEQLHDTTPALLPLFLQPPPPPPSLL